LAVFAADYAARYGAAQRADDGTVVADLLKMVLWPGKKPGRCGSFARSGSGASLQLNESQRSAVEGLRHRLEVIHGPPGTGKSTTILGLLQARVPSCRTACVTCVTNQALEAVSGKLERTCVELPFVVLGSLENLGVVSRQFLLEEQVSRADSVIEASQALKEIRRAVEEAQRCFDEAVDERSQQRWKKKLKDLQAQGEICSTDLDTISEREANRIVSVTKVFLCTTASLHRISMLQDEYQEHFPGSPHTVILDEAGATPESYIPQVLHTGVENLVLLGDHKQLPPLVITMDLRDVERKNVNQSLMERSLKDMPSEWVHQLTEQYRMPPTLCQLVSSLFYEHRLLTAVSRASAPQADPVIQWLMVQQPEVPVGNSKVNLSEAAIIVDWLREVLPQAKIRGETVKCITFYKLQRDLVRACFTESKDVAEIVVSVDASQGSEADHILLSTVRSNPEGDVGFCADPRRLCVALSRARKTLTIVGDLQCMSSGRWGKVAQAACEKPTQVGVATMAEVKIAFESMQRANTQPCRFFLAGHCSSAKCPYVHDSAPGSEALQALRETAKPCTFFAQRRCTKGSACPFSHDFDIDDPRVKADLRESQSSRDPCQYHALGKCTKGTACPFSHYFRPGDRKITAQIRQTAEPCQFYARGRCAEGNACTFSHDFRPGDRQITAQIRQTAEPCQFHARGRCSKGNACTFSHGPNGQGGMGSKGSKKGCADIRVPEAASSKGKTSKGYGKGSGRGGK